MDREPDGYRIGQFMGVAVGTGIGLALYNLGAGMGIGGAFVARRDEDG